MNTTLAVQGMTCQHCVQHVTEALTDITGVNAAKVTLDPPQAIVEHADTVSRDQMIAALVEEGFTAQ